MSGRSEVGGLAVRRGGGEKKQAGTTREKRGGRGKGTDLSLKGLGWMRRWSTKKEETESQGQQKKKDGREGNEERKKEERSNAIPKAAFTRQTDDSVPYGHR